MKNLGIRGYLIALCSLMGAFHCGRLGAETIAELQARYPDADLVARNIVEETTYQTDGTFITTIDQSFQILTEKGRKEARVIQIPYSQRYSFLTVERVEIMNTEGHVRPVDFQKTMSDMTDNSSTEANIYDPLNRVVTIQVPELAIGETVRSVYRLDTKKTRVPNQFFDETTMEMEVPILSKTYRILAPKEKPLVHLAVRNPIGNVTSNITTRADGRIAYEWQAKNSPQIIPEPLMDRSYCGEGQFVIVSTVRDWGEISRWYDNLCAPHLAKTIPEMERFVSELDWDIERIFNAVASGIRYMGLTLEDDSPGYAPHDVSLTFKRGHGVCRDKAALLVALLRLADFEAYPVLISVGSKMDPEIPLPYFNHAIVAVQKGEEIVLMDPTNETGSGFLPSYLHNAPYLIASPKGETLKFVPDQSPSGNGVVIETMGVVSNEGTLTGKAKVEFRGLANEVYRNLFMRVLPKGRVDFLQQRLGADEPRMEILNLEINQNEMQLDFSENLVITVDFRYPQAIQACDERYLVTLPNLTKQFGFLQRILRQYFAHTSRRFEMDLAALEESESIRIILPEKYQQVLSLPETIHRTGIADYHDETRLEEGVLSIERCFRIHRSRLSPADYDDVRRALGRCEDQARQMIWLKRSPEDALKGSCGDDVDRVIEDCQIDFTTLSPTSWRKVTKKTWRPYSYHAQREDSELKFRFHPGMGYVTVRQAEVLTPKGEKFAVGPEEMHLMDVDASGEPRYRSAKQLVVNLPSVGPGCLISTEVEEVVTNSPTALHFVQAFDDRDPVQHLKLTLDGKVKREEWNLPQLQPRENDEPHPILWRDCAVIGNLEKFDAHARRLEKFTHVAPYPLRNIPDLDVGGTQGLARLEKIRHWFARSIRIAGPELIDAPLDVNGVSPEVVLKERYATRLDYIRTLAAVLKGQGFAVDILFASNDAWTSSEYHDLMMTYNQEAYFSHPVCRVQLNGLSPRLGREYIIGTEGEWALLSDDFWGGSSYLDPHNGRVFRFTTHVRSYENKHVTLAVDANGSLKGEVQTRFYGRNAKEPRRQFAEQTPIERQRDFEERIGAFSTRATPLGAFEVREKNGALESKYQFAVPNYAHLQGDTLSVSFALSPFFPAAIADERRQTPYSLKAFHKCTQVDIVFPKEYTTLLKAPQDQLVEPQELKGLKIYQKVTQLRDPEGRLCLRIERECVLNQETMYSPEIFAALRKARAIFEDQSQFCIVLRKSTPMRELSHPSIK